jgi:hypothetical protein
MKVDIRLFLLFVALIIIVALLQRNCKRDSVITSKTTTTVHIDTLRVRDTVFYPKPYKVIELRIDTLLVDTSKIIRDYFTQKYYQLTHRDSLLRATAEIQVAENSIRFASLDYEIYRPTIHVTTMTTERKQDRFFLSLGGGINYCITKKSFGIEFLAAVGIKRHIIHLGYDFINQTPRLGWQYRIK